MTHKNIVVLNGHPGQTSLSHLLSEHYAAAATAAGHTVRIKHLSDLEFDADYGNGGYENPKPLEPVLEEALQDIEWSDHLVLVAPLWWGGLPAKLKGLIDRTFLPGRTFDTRNPKITGLPSPVLVGRSARVIVTSDTPRWFLRLAYRNAIIHQMRGQVLGFVGFKPVRFKWFSGASHPKNTQINQWVTKAEKLGAKAS